MITMDWDSDYELADEDGDVYVFVGRQTVLISHNADGTAVEIYERGFEDRDPLATAYTLDIDCEGDTDGD